MKTLIFLLLVSLAENAIASNVTIDFNQFTPGTTQHIEDGYILTASGNDFDPPKFDYLHSSQSPVSTINMVGLDSNPSSVTLTQSEGYAFDLVSIEIARGSYGFTRPKLPFDLTFSGILANGSSISQTFNYIGGASGDGLQTFVFSNFTNVTQVSWMQGLGVANLNKFDNIVLKSSDVVNVSPVPAPAAAWLFGSALFGLVSLRRKIKV